jgi:hypothetical protein
LKVAALYDVHGMPWTLEAVLADIGGAEEIVFGGDLLGGPYPERVVELARSVDARFVRGNSEREPSERDCERVPAEQLAWLAALPLTASLDGVLYCHAAPDDDMPITTIFTPDETLLERFDSGTVVIGHTHHQFDRRLRDLRVDQRGLGRHAVRGRGGRLLDDDRRRRARLPQHAVRPRAGDPRDRGERLAGGAGVRRREPALRRHARAGRRPPGAR